MGGRGAAHSSKRGRRTGKGPVWMWRMRLVLLNVPEPLDALAMFKNVPLRNPSRPCQVSGRQLSFPASSAAGTQSCDLE